MKEKVIRKKSIFAVAKSRLAISSRYEINNILINVVAKQQMLDRSSVIKWEEFNNNEQTE
jgi:hypothetical protein